MRSVTVVGGGIGGLVAAIELAERGWRVDLHERARELGGLGRTLAGPHRANVGPHAFYTDNPLFGWLTDRSLLPPMSKLKPRDLLKFRVIDQGRSRSMMAIAPGAARRLSKDPSRDGEFREWATSVHGEVWAQRLAGLASLPLFHHDPGALSAPTVVAALRSAYRDGKVRYVLGGFETLVETLACRAREVGVTLHTNSPVDTLPDPPCVLAIDLAAARRLTGDETLRWPSEPLALLDIAISSDRHDAAASLDLDHCVWANQYSRYDPSLTPPGTTLIQGHAGLAGDQPLDKGISAIEGLLDRHHTGWRDRELWRRRHTQHAGATPADPPGASWRDRPQVRRNDGLWVVNDRMAQPGLLSAVTVSAAIAAVADLCGETTPAASRH